MDVDDVAAELYGIAPEDFVKERDARAAEARQAGEAAAAKAIKALRRPSTSAWLANLLVRERNDQLAELLNLGAELREAQEKLAGSQMKALSQQRQQVVSALGHEARRLAAEAGHPVSDEIQRELEETLQAALSDPDSAEAVRSGQLTSALHYSGLGPAGTSPPKPADDPERAALEAEARRAQQELQAREQELEQVDARHQELRQRIVELQQQLDELRAEDSQAAKEVRAAQKACDAAAKAASRATSLLS